MTMNTEPYFKQLEPAQEHTQALCQQAEQALSQSPEQTALLLEIINQLTLSMEELQVAEEELRQQANVLQATNYALEAERQRYQELFESAPDGYLITDVYGSIQEMNRRAVELLGVPAGHTVGKLLVTFIPEAERAAFRSELGQLRSLTQTYVWESRLQPRGSNVFFDVEFTVSPAHDLAGKVVGLRWLVRDITDRKRAETQLQQSHDQLQTLTSHIHQALEVERTRIAREIHDQLGGDLTALKIEFTSLEKQLLPSSPALAGRARHIMGLIDNNIETVRHVAAELRPSILDDLGLTPAIEWQLEEFQSRTGLRCRMSTTGLPADLGLDEANATAIFRLFQEALTNIARHAQATQVKVKLTREANTLQIEIRDNGRGITPDQVKRSTSWGLIGMRERAALFSGTVEIKGEPGAGTTVVIRMPLN